MVTSLKENLRELPNSAFKNKYFKNGEYLVHYAARYLGEDELIYAIKRTGDPNIQNYDGKTPAHLFMERGLIFKSVWSVELFRGLKADFSIRDKYGNTPLHYMGLYLKLRPQTNYLKRYIDIYECTEIVNNNGETALQLAAMHSNAALHILLELGADVNYWVENASPLIYAMEYGVKNIRLLLEAGANPNTPDKLTGKSPLMYASTLREVNILLKYGAEPNIQDKFGKTALMWYALGGYRDSEKMISTLIKNGADPSLRDRNNLTFKDYLESNYYDDPY